VSSHGQGPQLVNAAHLQERKQALPPRDGAGSEHAEALRRAARRIKLQHPSCAGGEGVVDRHGLHGEHL
jgi:hypothetical protein